MLMAMGGVLKLVLAIATGLLWLVEIVDYYIYRLIGRKGFCAGERDPKSGSRVNSPPWPLPLLATLKLRHDSDRSLR